VVIDFKQFLHEDVQWTNSAYVQIFEPDDDEEKIIIPLQSSLLQKTVGTVPIYTAHVLGPHNLDNLFSIQNKKTKMLSTFTIEFVNDNLGTITSSGVWGGTGVIAILKGYAMGGGDSDINSIVDKQGIRYINISDDSIISYSAKKNANVDISKFSQKVQNMKLKILRDEMRDKPVRQNDLAGFFWIRDNDKQAQHRMIKSFYDNLFILIDKNKKLFHDFLFHWVRVQKNKTTRKQETYGYDEIVISNFKVIKLFLNKFEIKPEDYKMIKEKYKVPVKILPEQNIAKAIQQELKKLNK
jgi:hypothetical protein